MVINKMFIFIWVLAWVISIARSSNPVVPNVGMADPHVHYWTGLPGGPLFYMYATHDFAPNNTNFLMKNWWVWSSPDLVNWTMVSILLPQDTPSPPSAWDECWATDGATRDGHFYFYLSLGPNQVAVVNSTSPGGPWDNALKVPLLPADLGSKLNPPTTIRDPCVFADDDGSQYIIFGVFEYYIAKLGDDMMSLAEQPHYITVLDPLGPYGNETDDKPFLHKYNNTYYLSWGCFYSTSSNVYGPYQYRGSVVDTAYISPAFRMNDTSGPWYSHQDYADRHGSFWTANGQWYYSANDRSHSSDKANPSVFRDTILTYVHYFSNGSIAPVVIDGTGVATYNSGEIIEAENFFSIKEAHVAHDEKGKFGVYGINSKTELVYPHIIGVNAEATLVLSISNIHACKVILHMDKADGPVIGSAVLGPNDSLENYRDISVHLSLADGPLPSDLSLVVTFTATSLGEIVRLDSLLLI